MGLTARVVLRRRLALTLIVLSVLSLIVSMLAVWTRTLVFDTDRWVQTMVPVAEDPAVRHSLAVIVADKAVELSDLERRLETTLPDRTGVLAAPLTAAFRDLLVREVDDFLATPQAQRLWIQANRFAHAQLIASLEGENEYLIVGRQDVTLDLLPLVGVAMQRLEARAPGLFARAPRLASIDAGTPRAEILATLESTTGRDLRDDLGTVVLLEGEQGYQAQRMVALFKSLTVVVVVLTVALVAAALVISPQRRRTLTQLGVGVLVAMLLVRVAERQLERALVAALEDEEALVVAGAFVSAAVSSLDTFIIWLVVCGAALAVVAYVSAKPAWLTAARSFIENGRPDSGEDAPPPGATLLWLDRHHDVVRVACLVVGVVALLALADSLAWALLALGALVAAQVALWTIRRRVRPAGQDPPASTA